MNGARVARAVLLALLLSACQANIVTRLESSGAGTLTIEIGLAPDDLAQLRSPAGDPEASPCASLAVPGAEEGESPAFEEQRRGQEIWCISTQAFDDGSQLDSLYRQMDGIRIHELVEREGIFVYDLDVDLQAPQGAAAVSSITWAVELPGTIGQHNADRLNGQRLEWTLQPGESRRLTASSDLYALPLPRGLGAVPQWMLIGGGAVLCLGLSALLFGVGLIVFLVRGGRRGYDAG